MKAMRSAHPCVLAPLLLSVLALSASTGAQARSPQVVGGWSPIKNLADPYIREIAEFAITEHNKMKMPGIRKLQLKKIVSGEEQVVEGFNYSLVLEAKYLFVGAAARRYEAVVWDNPRFRKLTSFEPVKV